MALFAAIIATVGFGIAAVMPAWLSARRLRSGVPVSRIGRAWVAADRVARVAPADVAETAVEERHDHQPV